MQIGTRLEQGTQSRMRSGLIPFYSEYVVSYFYEAGHTSKLLIDTCLGYI
jgi:hypothetical protein